MKYKLLRILSMLLFLPTISGCSPPQDIATVHTEENRALLEETEDYGQDYLDSFIFLGESTTYHMKDRGVLKDGKNTKQVWAPDSGTVNLDTTTATLLIRYPDTGEYLTIGEAAARKKPAYLLLTFGLNGAVQNVKRGRSYFQSCYLALIQAIRSASPQTRIILQSAPPISAGMDMSRYSICAEELNRRIDQINQWTSELAKEQELRYLNTAQILKNPQGFLKEEFDVGDGHHLTREAYEAMLLYIRTHGYQ